MTPGDRQFESTRVRGLVVEAVEAAAELMKRPAVSEKWSEPSALHGMTVGALSAHLVRAAGATIAYLDRTPPEQQPSEELLTPVTYFRAALDAPIHDQIKEVSATEASVGSAEMADKCATVARNLQTRLTAEPVDRLVAALGGRMLSLDDFCRTRLIEVLLHIDDLAVSIIEPRPSTDPAGVEIVIEVLVDIARDRHGDWGVLHTLGRTERADPSVFPVI